MTPYEEGQAARREGISIAKSLQHLSDLDTWQWAYGWLDQLAEKVDQIKENTK
jgi:hypothetical protein|tara:strand:+ start:11013 stop:11171 length:159 start_codon:yes stop_codon:yes gene_type:complete